MSVLRAICLLVLLPVTAVTAHDLAQDEALRLRQEGVIMPLDTLTADAISRHPGSALLEVELEEDKGRYTYEIEVVLPDGLVRELEYDATSGKLLVDKDDD